MGRESRDSTTVFRSSIALLQERFRQLQRVKEMREERRQLLRSLSEHKHLNCIPMHYEPGRFSFNGPETNQFMLVSPLTPPQVSLSLGPTSMSYDKNEVCGGMGAPPLMMNLWPMEAPISDQVSSKEFVVHNYNYGSDSDFDTSLHL